MKRQHPNPVSARKKRAMSAATTTALNRAQLDQLSINTVRFLSVDAVQKANSGHPGLPLGAAPMAYVLWTRFLRHNPTQSEMVQSGPLRPVGGPRFDVALQLVAPHRL